MPRILTTRQTKKSLTLCVVLLMSLAGSSLATEGTATSSLNKLYQDIKEERAIQKKEDRQREAAFQEQKQEQKEKLATLKRDLLKKEAELKQLKQSISSANTAIKDTRAQLNERSHALKDLFSVWRQAVKDGKANMEASMASHKQPEDLALYSGLSQQSELPDSKDLRSIFKLLQKDIEQSARSITYSGDVVLESGASAEQSIQRIGTFSATSEGKFLIHNPAKNTLIALPKQPSKDIQQKIAQANYQSLPQGNVVEVVIDPSRGMVLEQLSQIPSANERFHQGGYIGYVIVLLGGLGLLLALYRWIAITHSQLAIRRQMKNPSTIDERNPLGKIIKAYTESVEHRKGERRKDDKIDNETLEVQLQEIVMSEMPRLDKGLGTIKLLAAIAPLLGLLGTVVGMINTFQSITLVGNADPKLMAGGISQALMTTVMGLLVAVPLLFSHNLLATKTKRVIIFLTQQSLGFIVKYMKHEDPAANKAPSSSSGQ